MPSSIDWRSVLKLFLEARPDSLPDLFLKEGFIEDPLSVTTALDKHTAQSFELETTLFFVLAVNHALRDHLLTDAEFEELRHFARLSRLSGNDILRYHEDKVRLMLCREIAVLLHDFKMDPDEMLRKARLQSLFDLGYDRFCDIVAEEFERVAAAILAAIGVSSPSELMPEDRNWLQNQMSALDGIFKISGRNPVRSIHNFPD